jgi:predicted transcriptional regulator YheO
MTAFSGFDDSHLDAVFELFGRVATAFVATLGPTAEIVVHDLRQPDSSVVAIAGDLTQRQIGAPIPDPEFLPDRLVEIEADQLCYATRTSRGHDLRSSTVFIRNRENQIVGAVCINVDRNSLLLARTLIERVLGDTAAPTTPPPLTTFAGSVEQLVELALDEIGGRIGRSRHQFTREDRVEAIRELDRSGVFHLRNAAVVVAAELGVSRASVFNYLRDVRQENENGCVELDAQASI